ncbi:MAG TPA: hypothetical protein VIJ50_10790 [Solirubrobacteraceae bacterium]
MTTVIACLALFFALGGTAIAAQHYLITSTSQIKPSVLAKLKGNVGAPGATGPQGPSGAQGPVGPVGPAGVQGPAGSGNLSALTLVEGSENRVPAYNEDGPGGYEGVEGSVATCPAGDHVVSGGSNVFAGIVEGEISVPSEDHESWIVVVANDSNDANGVVQALAYCARSGSAVAASAPRSAHAHAVGEAGGLLVKLAGRLKDSRQ